jgi:hypothetical protein
MIRHVIWFMIRRPVHFLAWLGIELTSERMGKRGGFRRKW